MLIKSFQMRYKTSKSVDVDYQLLRNAVHFKSKNELRHLFEFNTIDHKDDVRPELRAKGN